MIVSFNETHGFDCKFQAMLSANLCHCVSPQLLSLPCWVVLFLWIIFYDKKSTHSSITPTQSTNLQNCTLHCIPLPADANHVKGA